MNDVKNVNKTILVISDDPRHSSGVANQTQHFTKKFVQDGYNVVNVAVTTGNIENKQPYKFASGEEITIYTSQQYDNVDLIFSIMNEYKVDGIVCMTDPYRFMNLWNNSLTIRKTCPIIYFTIWDTYLVPEEGGKPHFNTNIYRSCDALGCCSKQTEWFVTEVLKNVKDNKPTISYVGHGSSPETYKPLATDDKELMAIHKGLFNGKDYSFVGLMVNRNQGRKKQSDLLEAWRLFTSRLTTEEANECALVLHCEPSSQYGTNLVEVASALCPRRNIYISSERYPENIINCLYNIADVCINVSNAEGFGLSLNEAMLAGKPVIAAATGGMFEQIGFFDNGRPITKFSPEVKENLKSYSHGIWSKPIFGQRTIIGSPITPYLYDENCSIDDIAEGLMYWYKIDKDDRKAYGIKGREWAINMGLTSDDWPKRLSSLVTSTINSFQPQAPFNIFKS